MINFTLMYILYTLHLKMRIKKLTNKLERNLKLKESILSVLSKYQEEIDFFLDIKYKDILKFRSSKEVDKIKFPIHEVYYKGKTVNFRAIKMYISRYGYINGKTTKLQTEIKSLKKQKVKKKIYKAVISKTNSKIIDAILNTNYVYKPLPVFGALGVIKNKNKRISINWGESNKRKKEIIERGEIPYYKKDAEKDPNYKGVKWLVYNPEIDFYLHWFKNKAITKFVGMYNTFIYKPARGGNGDSIVSLLAEKKADREFALKTYTNTLDNYEGV